MLLTYDANSFSSLGRYRGLEPEVHYRCRRSLDAVGMTCGVTVWSSKYTDCRGVVGRNLCARHGRCRTRGCLGAQEKASVDSHGCVRRYAPQVLGFVRCVYNFQAVSCFYRPVVVIRGGCREMRWSFHPMRRQQNGKY